MTFGIVFLGALVISSVYALGRTIYEKWIKTPPIVEDTPAVIPFHSAVRLVGALARDRVLAESPTTVLVLPRNEDGTIANPDAPAPGVRTVDVHDRNNGRHRQKIRGVAKVSPAAQAAV